MPLIDDLSLEGTERKNLISSFKNKKVYENIFLEDENEKYFRYLGSNFFYGKVDTDNNFIFPNEEDLIEVFYKNNNAVKLPQIVGKAFLDLQYYFAKANSYISKNSNYVDAFAAEGYRPIHQEYVNYLSKYYKAFFQKITYEKNKSIENIKDFIDVFLEVSTQYIKSYAAPVTRTGYISSNYFSPNSTGLVIDLYKIDVNNDQEKYDDYIKDLNYDFFIESASRFNFLVDKNIPSRLIFNILGDDSGKGKYSDLYSPDPIDNCGGFKPSGYFNQYNIKSIKDFFNKKYVRSMTGSGKRISSEYESLKVVIAQMYNTFSIPNQEFVFADIDKKNNIKLSKLFRQPLSIAEMNLIIPEQYWLKLLLYLRALETKQLWNQIEFNNFYSRTLVIYKNYGLISSLSFIETITKNILEVDRKKTLVLKREDPINKLNPSKEGFIF